MRTKTIKRAETTAKLTRLCLAAVLVILCACSLISWNSITKNGIIENTTVQFTPVYRGNRQFVDVAAGEGYVHIGGTPVGISISADGLIVMGECEVPTDSGYKRPLNDADIRKGDVLTAVNGVKVKSVYQLKVIVENADEGELTLSFVRDGTAYEINVEPAKDVNGGVKKLGLMLKEDIGGVGTLTFVTDDGKYAALGHYITDADTGLGSELNNGKIYHTVIDDVIKGERGKAGGLVADVNRLSKSIGDIEANTLIGLYGDYYEEPVGELYRVAAKGEAKIGAAQIYTTVDGGEPEFYDIDVVKVISQSEAGEKGMVIAVRDKKLLEKTGGIVQGMSGSPIVQNGLLIGAVTHVFVQDPTRGYAVHSRFMYDMASTIGGRSSVDYLREAA